MMRTRNNGETRLARGLRALRLQPKHVVKESGPMARALGLGEGISRTHLSRLRTGESRASADMILLLVATIRKMTGVAVRATDLFELEPAAAGGHGVAFRESAGDGFTFSNLALDGDRPSATQTLEVLYQKHASLLRVNARRRFRIPEDDLDALIQDVFASFLERQPRVNDVRAFLIAATNSACLHYWRNRNHDTAPFPLHEMADPAIHEEAKRWALHLAGAETLARLGQSCREALRPYYLSEERPEAIAEDLDRKRGGYLFPLLSFCRQRSRRIFHDLTEPKG